MSQVNNLQTLNGLFKETYADKLENIIPDGVKLLKSIKFVSKEKQNGNLYHQPVVLGLEHGVSFASSGDAFTLNDAIAGTIKDAQVQGTQMVLRSVLSYAAASRALSGGASAFESSTKFLVGNMLRSMARKLEIELLYGQVGYGTVNAIVGLQVQIDAAEWAPGIWAGAEGMKINFRSAGGADHGEATVTSVDMEGKKVSVDAVPGAAAVGDSLFHKGAFGNEFAGLHKILANSGTLFNISAAQFVLWKGNEYDAAGGPLSLTKITSAIARAVEKGLDQDVKCLVNPRTWSNLMSDQAALRRLDSSYKPAQAENGMSSIKFHGQNGTIEIEPSIYVKEGYAYILVMEELIRVGSSDITFKRPGQGDEFFRDLENAAGYELRAYCDQALFSSAPGKMVLIKNIVNT